MTLVLLVKNPPSSRIREQEKEEEMKSREHMKRRMDAVLALKNSITANRVGIRSKSVIDLCPQGTSQSRRDYVRAS